MVLLDCTESLFLELVLPDKIVYAAYPIPKNLEKVENNRQYQGASENVVSALHLKQVREVF